MESSLVGCHGTEDQLPQGIPAAHGWGSHTFGRQSLSEWRERNTIGRTHTLTLNSGTELGADLGFWNVIGI